MNALAANLASAAAQASAEHAWLEIPRLAARLLWRHWPALAFWFFAQRVCYDLLMDLAVKLGERSVSKRMGHARAIFESNGTRVLCPQPRCIQIRPSC